MSTALTFMDEDLKECPLCLEVLVADDLTFFPCTCGYQICRFCWHKLRTENNGLCPACRKQYQENPANFKPLSKEQLTALKVEKKNQDQLRKQKILDNRKQLENVRVVQKNLVFVVGLPPKLADADVLKKHEYFGKFGKVIKIVINPNTAYAGSQTPSASAYVTYSQNNDALRAIQAVNNVSIEGKIIKTSLGTTKYCSYFMKRTICPKADCIYLHKYDQEATFTKEEIIQGKHHEYEKRLHDNLIQQTNKQENLVAPPKAPLSSRLVNPVRGNAWSGNTSSSYKSNTKHVKSAGVPKELKIENTGNSKKINKNDSHLSTATHQQNSSISKQQNTGTRRNLFGQSVGSGDSSTGVTTNETLSETKYPHCQNLGFYTADYNSSSAGDGRLSQQISQEDYPTGEGIAKSSFINMSTNSQVRTVFKENPNIYTQKMYPIQHFETRPIYYGPKSYSSHSQSPGETNLKNIQSKKPVSSIDNESDTSHIAHKRQHGLEINEELGFDPFEETQKGLAELMQKEKINQNKRSQCEATVTKTNSPSPGFNNNNIGMANNSSTLHKNVGSHYKRRQQTNDMENSEVILKKYSTKPEYNSIINLPVGCMRIPGTQFLLQRDPDITTRTRLEQYNSNTHYTTQPRWPINDERLMTNNLLLHGRSQEITVDGNQQSQDFQNTDIPLLLNNTQSESNN